MQDIRPLPQMDSYGTAANLRMTRRNGRARHYADEEQGEDDAENGSGLRLSFDAPQADDDNDGGRSSLESLNEEEIDNGTGVRMFHTLSHYLRESRDDFAAPAPSRDALDIPIRGVPRNVVGSGNPGTMTPHVYSSPVGSTRFSSYPREVDSPSGPFPSAAHHSQLVAHQMRHAARGAPRYFDSLRVQAPKSPPKPLPQEDEPEEGPAGALLSTTRRARGHGGLASIRPPSPRRSSLLSSAGGIREDDSEASCDESDGGACEPKEAVAPRRRDKTAGTTGHRRRRRGSRDRHEQRRRRRRAGPPREYRRHSWLGREVAREARHVHRFGDSSDDGISDGSASVSSEHTFMSEEEDSSFASLSSWLADDYDEEDDCVPSSRARGNGPIRTNRRNCVRDALTPRSVHHSKPTKSRRNRERSGVKPRRRKSVLGGPWAPNARLSRLESESVASESFDSASTQDRADLDGEEDEAEKSFVEYFGEADLSRAERKWRRRFRKDRGHARISCGMVIRRRSVLHDGGVAADDVMQRRRQRSRPPPALTGPQPKQPGRGKPMIPGITSRRARTNFDTSGGALPTNPTPLLPGVREKVPSQKHADSIEATPGDADMSMAPEPERPSGATKATVRFSDAPTDQMNADGHSAEGNATSLPRLANLDESQPAGRRSDAFNEDRYDFAIIVRVAFDQKQIRALSEARARADAIAAANARIVGQGASPGMRYKHHRRRHRKKEMQRQLELAGDEVDDQGSAGDGASALPKRKRTSAVSHRSLKDASDSDTGARPIRLQRSRLSSVEVSDSASLSDTDNVSDSSDDFFDSSDDDQDVEGDQEGEEAETGAVQENGQVGSYGTRGDGGAEPGALKSKKSQRAERAHKCAEILASLRHAGLKAKRVRSLSRTKWLIKIRAPEWRLEEEAERTRLRMRRRDGGWSRFKRSLRHAFVPVLREEDECDSSISEQQSRIGGDGEKEDASEVVEQEEAMVRHEGGRLAEREGSADGGRLSLASVITFTRYQRMNGSLFHSSDRQTLINNILRSSTAEGGAEFGSHTPLGAYVTHMFPLHMYARLNALRNDWLTFWRVPQSVPELDRIGDSTADRDTQSDQHLIPLSDTATHHSVPASDRRFFSCSSCGIRPCGWDSEDEWLDHHRRRRSGRHSSSSSSGRRPLGENPPRVDPDGSSGCCCCCCSVCSRRNCSKRNFARTIRRCSPCCVASCVSQAVCSGCRCLGRFGKNVLRQPLDRIAAYFGETVAFYFAWLEFYTRWLVFPAAVGALLFFAQVWYGMVDITWVPLFSLFMAVWSTLFLEFWRRRNSDLAQRWGVLNFEHEEVTRPEFRGEWRQDPLTGEVLRFYPAWKHWLKVACSTVVVIASLSAVIMAMLFIFTTRDTLLASIEREACLSGDQAYADLCARNGSALYKPPIDLSRLGIDWNIGDGVADNSSHARRLHGGLAGDDMSGENSFRSDVTAGHVLAEFPWGSDLVVSAARLGISLHRPLQAAVDAAMTGAVRQGARNNSDSSMSSESSSGGGSSTNGIDLGQFEIWISLRGNVQWWVAMLLPPAAYGILIPCLDFLFGKLAVRLNGWENHRTESNYRNHRIAKVFSFRFVNSFISLFYYAFSPQSSLLQLTVQLAAFLIMGQIWNTVLDVFFPYLGRKYRECRFRAKVERAEESGLTEGRRGRRLLRHARSQAWAESRLSEYDTFNEYAKMLIQFGYVTFFSWAFPLAPLCALINNVVEMRTDAYKLCHNTQRPIAHKASGIGVWFNVLQGMSVLAVLTNCAHLALTSRQFSLYFPKLSDAQKILVIFLFEHLVLSLRVAIGYLIPHTPADVRQRIRRDNHALAQLQGRLSVS